MFKNYLRIAARILVRNKLYTVINVLGLALGVCGCIVIWQVSSFELSFDRFHPDGDRIYRVVAGAGQDEAEVLPPIPEAMRSSVLGLERVTTYFPYDQRSPVVVPGLRAQAFRPRLPGDDRATGIIIADSNWFHIFPYRWLAGNPAVALGRPFQVVLTENAVKRYFGPVVTVSYQSLRAAFSNPIKSLKTE
jgi:putative ABC transport system permease protein